MRILFTGGGTGGHIYPLIAVAQQLMRSASKTGQDIDLVYLGAPDVYGGMLEQAGFIVYRLPAAKLRRYFDVRNFIDLPKFFWTLFLSFWKMFWIMPDAVFSKGGPGALPVVIAASFYRIPILVHESDSVFGLTNRLSSKYADRIAISFDSALSDLVSTAKSEKQKTALLSRIALIGNPIRENFFKENDLSETAAKKILGFDDKKPLIFVVGGSQGATRINDFFFSMAGELISSGFQVLHQVGLNNFESAQRDFKAISDGMDSSVAPAYRIEPYFGDNIKDVYRAADLIISRAGSGSVFEIAAAGKPSILIPLPEAAYDHQAKNAYAYSRVGASIVMEEVNLSPHLFMDQIQKILKDPQLAQKMSAAARSFSRPDAAKTIALELLKLAGASIGH